MKITWYGHSCFKIETELGSAVLDPYAPGSVPGLSLPALEADVVLCSHEHHDHAYAAGVTLSGRTPGFDVRMVSVYHDEVRGLKRGRNTIHVLTAESLRFAHCGDLGHRLSPAQLRELGPVDILAVPVGGFYTIDAVTAKEVCDSIGAKILLPMHYRSATAGYDVLTGVESFTGLYDSALSEYIDGNSVTLSGKPTATRVIVL